MVFSNLSVHLKGYISGRNQVSFLKNLTVALYWDSSFRSAFFFYYLYLHYISDTMPSVLTPLPLIFIGLDTPWSLGDVLPPPHIYSPLIHQPWAALKGLASILFQAGNQQLATKWRFWLLLYILALRWGGFTCLQAQAEQFTVDLVRNWPLKNILIMSKKWLWLRRALGPWDCAVIYQWGNILRVKTCTSLLSFTW